MKSVTDYGDVYLGESPPSRRRGLKLEKLVTFLKPVRVASLAEAWIEINSLRAQRSMKAVASLAEAWIEIGGETKCYHRVLPSPPSRRRGLKWTVSRNHFGICASPPSRRRGLKFDEYADYYPTGSSPPSRRRGLKSVSGCGIVPCTVVASLAEAWIEIPVRERTEWRRKVASLAEAWIEITTGQTTLQTILRRLPRGGVD